ncbi:hypothetical protein ACLOJK_031395 [Asimina triloba]
MAGRTDNVCQSGGTRSPPSYVLVTTYMWLLAAVLNRMTDMKKLVEDMLEKMQFHTDLMVALKDKTQGDILVKPRDGPPIPAHRALLSNSTICKEMLEKHSFSLLLASDTYKIPFLKKFCENRILGSLDKSNALDVMEISEACSSQKLKESAMRSVVQHLEDVVFSPKHDGFALRNPLLSVEITRAVLREARDWKRSHDIPKRNISDRANYIFHKNYGVQDLIDVLRDCASNNSIREGKAVHGYLVKLNFCVQDAGGSLVLFNHVAYMYVKCSHFTDACRLFDEMPERNAFSWTVMIVGSTENELYLDGFKFFLEMLSEGVCPDKFAYSTVIQSCIGLGRVEFGKMVHALITKSEFSSNTFINTSLLNMYAKFGEVNDSVVLFETMNDHSQVTWNAMISGLASNNLNLEAYSKFCSMMKEEFEPNIYTFSSVLKAIGKLGDNVRKMHGLLAKFGDESRVLSADNALMDAYAKCEHIEGVTKIFRSMKERDVISWTTVVRAYAQCLEEEQALNTFLMMLEENVIPNQFTFSSILVTCASLCLLEFGRQVHGLLLKEGFMGYDDCVESTLINMYAKCGSIDEAERVFEKIVNPDVISWTAIILGYAQHGLSDHALSLFRKMEESGMKPTSVTIFHGGLVDEGLLYFQSMKEKYGLVPEMEHYACVVDLLSRVGHLDDAMEFINGMPIEPTEMVWQTLLGACRVRGNVDLGEIAARKILSVRPDYSATYVLLANTYIETGSLDDGLSLRHAMKVRGVKKEPGCSWIVTGGRVHKFFSRDQQHVRKGEIYAKLDELMEKMEATGYQGLEKNKWDKVRVAMNWAKMAINLGRVAY